MEATIASSIFREICMVHCSAKSRAAIAVLTTGVLFAAPAWAHIGADHAFGLSAGFAHPFSGLDHLLAMLAVGIWAAQHRRAALWLLPLAFPLMMAAGAYIGIRGIGLSGAEAGIAGSVTALGLLIAFAVRPPLWASAGIVSSFALMHGYAHGLELPQHASPLLYGTGFIAATILLHLAGIAAAGVIGGRIAHGAVRAVGALIAIIGAYMLTMA
jgi:urease accessory protein